MGLLKLCPKHFLHINTFSPPNNIHKVGTIISPLLQIRKLRH